MKIRRDAMQINLDVQSLAVSDGNLFARIDGGILRSTDNGKTWTHMDIGLINNYVQVLAVNGSNLFAGTLGSGVFRSTDNGETWIPINTGLTDLNIYALAVIGSDLIVETWSGIVHLSTNKGDTWTEEFFLYRKKKEDVMKINFKDLRRMCKWCWQECGTDVRYFCGGEKRDCMEESCLLNQEIPKTNKLERIMK
ncbi:hypothetical protein HY745_02860 [Candidatus Desantisbacteria bacterium]|nr:hypothetical protein [Candidatus Desantisbacteria bacterium]